MLILKGHKGRLRCLAFSPDGRWIASAAGGGTTVSLWDATKGKRLGFLGGHPSRVIGLGFAPVAGGLLASREPAWPGSSLGSSVATVADDPLAQRLP